MLIMGNRLVGNCSVLTTRVTTESDLIISRPWGAAHDGLHCYHPDGSLIGKLRLPEITGEPYFRGRQRNHLYITATSSLYGIRVNLRAASYPMRICGCPPPAA